MNTRINFFGVNLDIITLQETLERISEFIKNKACVQHVVVNVAKLVYAQKDSELKDILNACPLINVDGAGVILGAKFLGIDIPERVAGIEILDSSNRRKPVASEEENGGVAGRMLATLQDHCPIHRYRKEQYTQTRITAAAVSFNLASGLASSLASGLTAGLASAVTSEPTG